MSQRYAMMILKDGVIEDILSMSAGERRLEVVHEFEGPSMTRAEFTDECDINQIMARYEKAGGAGLPPPPGVPPVYYDFVGMPDLQTALNSLYDAEEAFMRLPATVRREFDNDPVRFVEFASDEKNLSKMREWGLAAPEKRPDAPVRVEVVQQDNAPKAPGPGAAPAPAASSS